MKNKSYIGISFVILIFGIIFIPRIIERIKNGTVVQGDRIDAISNHKNPDTGLILVGPVPKFQLTDQNNKSITNKEYETGILAFSILASILNRREKVI